MQLAIWPAALAGDLFAIDRVLKVMSRRAKLLGLDQPKKVALSGDAVLKNFAAIAAKQHGLDVDEIMAEAKRILAAGFDDSGD